jgi:manganese/zinc/iron transport system permease protein
MNDVINALSLAAGYNATLVILSTAILGAVSGMIGTFVILNGKALISDTLGHATLPGLGAGFLLAFALTGEGRNLPVLLICAALSALASLWCLDVLKRRSTLDNYTAMAAVLSTFFAFGVVLLTLIQALPSGGQAGLSVFLLGSASGLLAQEAVMITVAAMIVALVLLLFWKELGLVCFDPDHAMQTGLSKAFLERLILGLLLIVILLGLKTVGLILSVALTLIPAITARFWTKRLLPLLLFSACLGACSGYVGAAFSAAFPNLPTGPTIVLSASTLFSLSILALLVRSYSSKSQQ